MNKLSVLVGLALGMVFSVFFTGLVLKIAAPTTLFKEIKSTYGFEKTVSMIQTKIDNKEDWHVTAIIDQQKEILNFGGKDVGKIKIIQFFNPKLSAQMLLDDDTKFMSTKMPHSISVYEKNDGSVTIGLMNAHVMAELFSLTKEGVAMQKVAKDMESVLSFLHFKSTIF
jgi:uncharacterized protein (DUF302 family)